MPHLIAAISVLGSSRGMMGRVSTEEISFVELDWTVSEPLVLVVPELSHDAATRARAAHLIGAVARGAWDSAPDSLQPAETVAIDRAPSIGSLFEAVKLATDIDDNGAGPELRAAAVSMIWANASCDVIERIIKAGHIMEIAQDVDADSRVHQHGQAAIVIQANSLRFLSTNPVMRPRIEAETRNSFRMTDFYVSEWRDDYYFVTLSRAPDDMTVGEMDNLGFFVDTMSCAIQVTDVRGNQLVTESAFVAGTDRPGGPRHDQATIEKMGEQLGIDLVGLSATGLLDRPVLIHKSLLPDGAINLVELYDDCAGGTFFGEAKPRQDYHEYRRKCSVREAGFQPKVESIVAELIAEAATITTPQQAVNRLHKISGEHMIELASEDRSINPQVFGTRAGARIELARWHLDIGNVEAAHIELREAKKHDRSNSCPSGGSKSNTDNEASGEGGAASDAGEAGDCSFTSKECPLCHKKNVKTTVKILYAGSGKRKQITGDCKCSLTVKAGY